jgi:hypothetical protein
MSRSGLFEYDGDEAMEYGRWRGQVASSIRGKRGQSMLRQLAEALDAMTIKQLAPNVFQNEFGCMCALGVLAAAKGIDSDELQDLADAGQFELLAEIFDVSHQLAQEIIWINDENSAGDTPEAYERGWINVREWVNRHIIENKP